MNTPSKKELGLVAFVGLLLSIVWTWPLAGHLGDGLPYNESFVSPAGSDNHIWVWDFWWVQEALTSGQNPFVTDQVLPPFANGLGLHTHVFLYGILALPLTMAFGAPFAVGAVMLVLFAAAFTAMWWCARVMGLSRQTAFFMAIGWAFAPYFMQKSLDHLCHVAQPWTPLVVGFLVRVMERPGARRAPLWIAGALLPLAAAAWVGPLYGLLVVLFACAVFVVKPPASVGLEAPVGAGSRLEPVRTHAFVLLAALTALVVSPPALAVWKEVESSRQFTVAHGAAEGEFTVTGRELVARPTLESFIALPELSPLGHPDLSAVPGGNEISALHLSGAILVCAVLGLYLGRGRGLWRWALLSLVFLVGAWDPGTPWGAPSDVYRELPLMDGFRVTTRWFANGLFPLLVLAGAGFERLWASQQGTKGRFVPPVLTLLLVAGSWTRPLPMMATTPPKEILELGSPEEPEEFLLTLPAQFGASRTMTWQTYHERGVVVSFLARPNPWSIRGLQEGFPDLYRLLVPTFGPAGAPELPSHLGLAQDLDSVNVRTLVVDVAAFGELPELVVFVADYLDDLPGWARENEHGEVLVWKRK